MSYIAPNPRPYRSSAWSDVTASGQPRIKFPLPQEATIQLAAYAFDQSFQMAVSSFGSSGPSPKNTPASTFSTDCTDANAILTSYSQPADKMGGLCEFDASFHRVPASWSDFKQLPYTFPGFAGAQGYAGWRPIDTLTVPCRIQYDYFVLDPANVLSGCIDGTPAPATAILDSSGAAPTCVYKLGDIPQINRSFFCITEGGAYTPNYSSRTMVLAPAGGIGVGDLFWQQTLPKKETFIGWASNASTSRWNSTVWNGTSDSIGTVGQLVAEDSRIEAYAGNIIQRITIYVLAK